MNIIGGREGEAALFTCPSQKHHTQVAAVGPGCGDFRVDLLVQRPVLPCPQICATQLVKG